MRRSGEVIYSNTSRTSNDIVLQKIQTYTVKAACAMTDACDKIMKMNLKSDQCREMIIPLSLML